MNRQDENGSRLINWAATGPRLLYLLISFPTGIASFVFAVTLLSVGIGTLIIGIGIPVLLALFRGSRFFLAFERKLSRNLLGMQIPDSLPPLEPGGLLEKLIFQAGRLETWIGILYLVLKLPLGIMSLVSSLVAVILPLSLAAAAFLSLFLTALPVELGWGQTLYLDPLSGAALLGLLAVVTGFLGVLLMVSLSKLWEGVNGVVLRMEQNWLPASGEGQAVVIP